MTASKRNVKEENLGSLCRLLCLELRRMSCIALVFQGDIHQGWGLLYICPITDSHKFLIVLWSMALNGGQRWRPSGGHG